MDSSKSMDEYKKEWFNQVETDSINLFSIAEKAIEKKPNLSVIIVKRLPRYDRSSKDILGIKSKLSAFGNTVYDQLWMRRGCPKNIHIVELNLNCQDSAYLKKVIFDDVKNINFDGIHLRGPGASRHFTYRAVQAIKPVLESVHKNVLPGLAKPLFPRSRKPHSMPASNNTVNKDNHSDCEQAQYMKQKLQQRKTYAQATKSETVYSVPTSNYYGSLNC